MTIILSKQSIDVFHSNELLLEKESMWAKILEEVLKDNNIPCVTVPVLGAGLTLKTGMQERLKVYVPSDSKLQAEELMNELFPAEGDMETSSGCGDAAE